jgi:hypothetical protein
VKCLACELDRYTKEQLSIPEFFEQRKEELFPEALYGDEAYLCLECVAKLHSYFSDNLPI